MNQLPDHLFSEKHTIQVIVFVANADGIKTFGFHFEVFTFFIHGFDFDFRGSTDLSDDTGFTPVSGAVDGGPVGGRRQANASRQSRAVGRRCSDAGRARVNASI